MLIILSASICHVYSQNKVTVSGFIQNEKTSEMLIGASVIIKENNKGTTSNRYGFYSLTLFPGEYTISFGFVGYEQKSLKLKLLEDSTLNIQLKTDLKIDEVTVKGRSHNPDLLNSTEIGTNLIPLDVIKKTPVIAGENDVLKTLQFLPGIKQSQEGTAGINVRGGSPDQNQILLDGVPVYNTSHLFGFLSVFNSDALSHVKMYKGGIPARYGGRLSSVLDISMKEGNMKHPEGTFSISPIAGRITIEGPIKEDTASFILSGRRTFLDIPLRVALKATQPIQAGYFFHDYTAKANWKINSKNRLYFSSYLGKDKYFMNYKEKGTKTNFAYNWGNITSVFRMNSMLSPKLFSNTTVYYSNFYNKQKIRTKDEESFLYDINSGLKDFSVGIDFDWYPNLNHAVKFGIKSSYQVFSPQIIKTKSTEIDTMYGKGIEHNALIASVFLEDDIILSSKLGFNYGIRGDLYKTGNKKYLNLQPRISVRYLATPKLSLKSSYTKMGQYLHLLSNSSYGLPTDLWVSSTENVRPQKAWQISAGVFFKPNKVYEFSVEGYFKGMDNVIHLHEGESFLDSRHESWEKMVITGQGSAYGLEFLFKKNIGKLTGWAGYSLSWSNRKFTELNNGRPFPYRYDKRHDLSVLGEYKLYDDGIDSKSFTFGFTFNTGSAVTIPDIKHQGLNILTDEGDNGYLGLFDYLQTRITYDAPNNYRMPNFHHLDIGYHITRKLSNYRSQTWSFSVYNLYNRLNPWYYYNKGEKLIQVSLFPIIPSVSFTYKW